MVSVRFYDSPLGLIRLTYRNGALTELVFTDLRDEESSDDLDSEVVTDTVRWLDTYFSGSEPDFLPKMELQGTEFQKRVWELISKIPYGSTCSYSNIAKKLAEVKS